MKNKAIAYLNDQLSKSESKDLTAVSNAVYGSLRVVTDKELAGLEIEIKKLVTKAKRENKNLEQPQLRRFEQWLIQIEQYVTSTKQLLVKNPKGFGFSPEDEALMKPKAIPNVSQELINRLKADGIIPTRATPSSI